MVTARTAGIIPMVALAMSAGPLISACGGRQVSAPATSALSATPAVPMTIADPYQPKIDPAMFSTTINNPYFPMVPGTRTIYDMRSYDGLQRTVTEVTHDTKTIMGVQTVVVHDTVSLDNTLVEDTHDWYTQDRDGNVWYFGEDTKAIGDNGAVDTTGSFEGGVNGALPGILMPAHPRVGDQYRQEYAKDVAEDAGEVLNLHGTETTPLTGQLGELVVTRDTDRLDPTAPPENKYYARGIGLILTVEPDGRDEAVKTEKF